MYQKAYGCGDEGHDTKGSVPGVYTIRSSFEKASPSEYGERDPLASPMRYQEAEENKSPLSKKWLPFLACGALSGLLVAMVMTFMNSSSDFNVPVEATNSFGYCSNNDDFTKQTLKPLVDRPVHALLKPTDLKGQRKFEASDMTYKDGYFYSVCDSSWSILKVHEDMNLLSDLNSQLGDPDEIDGAHHIVIDSSSDSDFESIILDATSDEFYVLREAVDISTESDSSKKYHSVVMKVEISENEYKVVDYCPSEHEFDGRLNGFEGAVAIRGVDGVLYIMGLCEGNHCAEPGLVGDDKGNGRMVIMKRADGDVVDGFDCYWKTIRTIDIPSSAFFEDYSGISLHRSSQSAAIISQQNSQLWVGTLNGGQDGVFDPMTVEFDADSGAVYDFPRNANCEIQYCNVEGIQWVEATSEGDDDIDADAPRVVAAVSDKMKSKGRQSFTCLDKDQSFHLFAIP